MINARRQKSNKKACSLVSITASPSELAKVISNNRWKLSKHLKFIENALLLLTKRRITKLVINLPPRHGKSELISKYFPLWYLCQFPIHQVMLISYGASFASTWSRKVRDLIAEFSNQLINISLSKYDKSSQSFTLSGSGGGMYAIGAGGSITGRGADLIIIDDPIKNETQANSAYYREKLWDWFNSTVFTRLEPNGIITLVMTRWNEDDICGRLIRNHLTIEIKSLKQLQSIKEIKANSKGNLIKKNWCLIKIPAIAGPNDILLRKEGHSLWNDRFDLNKLLEIKQQIGTYWFSALYQQEPLPFGKGIFEKKYFRYFDSNEDYYTLFDNQSSQKFLRLKSNCNIFITSDLAISEKNLADYTVFIVSVITERKEILILDIVREKINAVEHLKILKNLAMQWSPCLIGIESVQYQTSLIQTALAEGLPIKSLRPTKDKVTRALAISARLELGQVYFKLNANWLMDFENELASFPKGRFDDQVDAFAYIAHLVEFQSENKPASLNVKNRTIKKLISGF